MLGNTWCSVFLEYILSKITDSIQQEKTKITNKRKKERLLAKEFILNYKSNRQCQQCGEKDLRCLAFHHREPENKRFTVHSGSSRHYSLKSIKEEIDKCDVLCLNCHAKIHNGNGNGQSHRPGKQKIQI